MPAPIIVPPDNTMLVERDDRFAPAKEAKFIAEVLPPCAAIIPDEFEIVSVAAPRRLPKSA